MAAVATVRAPARRLRTLRAGLWLFFVSESFLFAALISARYYLAGFARPAELNQALGLFITAVLLASSLFAYRAEASIICGDRRRFLANTLATVVLGALFLVGVGLEWAEAFVHFPPRDRFGTVFFTLTGTHGLHVLSGVLLLLGVYLHGRRGRYSPEEYWPVEAAVKYWHYVDVVWVFIYPTLYLVTA
ncbi:MAG: cytochrome c oxidase subunit 3 [Armatimonadota bacterium]|nr:cytochrome c oxidase subunit 3 [Armatimonadota bacterium]MDR7451517.1 cytochrome c oxidase subunit 3 [Armatimonadota bacterium]MDR7467484.1 cytochrome c oxidase subunit 3 [Armatimonadota bacterium]MDR7494358.1 cytochrome c oxidase subunit 3 [Armatimonadota bacterium]MDR7499175.1 cytochrome c oxidase subunit 3 [Armatimonadota bacterium]